MKNIDVSKPTRITLSEILYNSLAQAAIKCAQTHNKPLKIYLFLFIIGSISLASYMLIESVIEYFSYEVITIVRNLPEKPSSLFPVITICNQNMFTTSYAKEFVQSINSSWNVFTNREAMANSSYKDNFDARINFFNLAIGSVFKENFTQEKRQKLGHHLDDILISCFFSNQKCSSDDFVWKFDSLYGNCYMFNSDAKRPKESTIPGWINGLILELYVNIDEDLKEFNSVYGGLGALVRIDNGSYRIDHGWEGIQVQAGLNTYIALSRAFNFILPKPYSNCEIDSTSPKAFNSELYDLIAKSEYHYNEKICFEQCYQRQAMFECNFTDSNFLSLYPQQPVKTNEQYECVNNVYTNKYLSRDFIENTCMPLCPLECNQTVYKASVTTTRLFGNLYVDYIKRNPNISIDFRNKTINVETTAESVARVYIFYDSLSYEMTTESPKISLPCLLASIGGNLSLFLGVSLFSICEIVEVLIEMVYEKRKNAQINTDQN